MNDDTLLTCTETARILRITPQHLRYRLAHNLPAPVGFKSSIEKQARWLFWERNVVKYLQALQDAKGGSA